MPDAQVERVPWPTRVGAGVERGVGFVFGKLLAVGGELAGGDLVPEKVTIESFFAPGGGLTFLVEGTTPSYFQVLEKAHWIDARPPYAQEVLVEVPLVETDPGGNDASVTAFTVKVGAAYRHGKKTVSYFTQPKKCPRGGFPVKMEIKFLSGETVIVSDRVPCPLGK